MPKQYEILLKNGHVVDPVNGRNCKQDIAVAEGRIIDIAQDLNPTGQTSALMSADTMSFPGLSIHISMLQHGWAVNLLTG